MSSQHKANPVTFRPPPADRAWLYEHAKAVDRSVGSILTEALAAYREATERDTKIAVRGKAASHG